MNSASPGGHWSTFWTKEAVKGWSRKGHHPTGGRGQGERTGREQRGARGWLCGEGKELKRRQGFCPVLRRGCRLDTGGEGRSGQAGFKTPSLGQEAGSSRQLATEEGSSEDPAPVPCAPFCAPAQPQPAHPLISSLILLAPGSLSQREAASILGPRLSPTLAALNPRPPRPACPSS